MKIISCNVNGIRSAYRKGLIDFIKREQPDILCLQEIKAFREDMVSELCDIKGYCLYINSASKKGYSGVAIYSRQEPLKVNNKLGIERFDSEGRMLELEYDDFVVMNLYIPHGGRQKENLDYKLAVYNKILKRARSLKGKKLIMIGDFNIAHQEIDLARPKQNMKNIMFSPDERRQIDEIINLGFFDSFRLFNGDSSNYTWWPYAFNAKERNMGWRIDYAFVSNNLLDSISRATIYNNYTFSDHCPIGLELS